MKAKNLMIGDWILDGRVYAQVTSITCDGIIETTHNEFSNIELVEPIPLTPEIFKKNGFILKEGEKGVYGVTIATHYVRDDLPFEVFCDGEPFSIWFQDPVNIKYVHQLQHALRLCGIEKEITL